MKFSDREIAREIKFPDPESREIGKYLCTCPEILILHTLETGTYYPPAKQGTQEFMCVDSY